MTDDEAGAAVPSIYAARAATKATRIVVAGISGALLSLAMFLFLLVFPADSGRDYPVLVLLAGWTTASVFFAIRGYDTLRRNRTG